MNDQLIVAVAVRRGRGLDQPDLAEHLTAHSAWEAWTPVEALLELSREAEELIDAASAELGHLTAGGQRRHAWRCADAAAWGLATPLPQLPDPFHRVGRKRGALRALVGRRQRRHRP
jgi:hypothetical protein